MGAQEMKCKQADLLQILAAVLPLNFQVRMVLNRLAVLLLLLGKAAVADLVV